jgi:hypothetical protein
MMVVADALIMVVTLPWMMVVAEAEVLFVAVLPENPSITLRQNIPGSQSLVGFGPHTSGYGAADWLRLESLELDELWTVAWMKELVLEKTDDEPSELDEWSSGLADNELVVPCGEMRAAAITISPTIMAQTTRKKLLAARPILPLADPKPHRYSYGF